MIHDRKAATMTRPSIDPDEQLVERARSVLGPALAVLSRGEDGPMADCLATMAKAADWDEGKDGPIAEMVARLLSELKDRVPFFDLLAIVRQKGGNVP
jgi:hypothetical protein